MPSTSTTRETRGTTSTRRATTRAVAGTGAGGTTESKHEPGSPPSFTIGTDASRLPATSADAQRCVTDAYRAHIGKPLGCGEQGCTYTLVEHPTHVIKVTPFRSAADGAAWAAEARVGERLGALGIAPRIQHHFTCDVDGRPTGFIVMDRLRDAKTVLDVDGNRVVVRVKARDAATGIVDTEDHLAAVPPSIQRGFLDVLAAMLDAGYVHNDAHWENLGFLPTPSARGGEKPIIFDFGFTRAHRFTTFAGRALALAFSVAQMLEHVPAAELEGSLLYAVFTGVLNGSWTWGAPYDDARETPLVALARRYPASRTTVDALKAAAAVEAPPDGVDFWVGCACYAALLPLARRRRYATTALMDAIYFIRQGKPY